MASIEATLRRRANRAAARLAKERKVVERVRVCVDQPPPIAAVPAGSSRRERRREASEWQRRVAERMALRFDPDGVVTGIFRLDYRYWECRAAGYDPEAEIIGYRNAAGHVVPDNVLRHGRRTVVDAVVYDWWRTLHWEDRRHLRFERQRLTRLAIGTYAL